MKQTTRLITNQEMEMVNPKIRERFGAEKVIESGSVIENEEGKKTYYIVVKDHHSTQANGIKKLGEMVKETFEAQAVYYYGVQIA